jgi:hypothetical protein
LPIILCSVVLLRLLKLQVQESGNDSASTFNTEQAVERWTALLLEQGAIREEDALELQDHLWEELQHQGREDKDEQAAFEEACRRLGTVEALNEEFSKVNRRIIWRSRSYWVLMGILSLFCFRMLTGALVTLSILPFWHVPNGPEPTPRALFLALDLAHSGLWCLGCYLFLRLAKKPFLRNETSGKIENVMPLPLPAMLFVVLGGVAVFSLIMRILLFRATDIMIPGLVLIWFLQTDLPLLFLVCFGLLWLYRTPKPPASSTASYSLASSLVPGTRSVPLPTKSEPPEKEKLVSIERRRASLAFLMAYEALISFYVFGRFILPASSHHINAFCLAFAGLICGAWFGLKQSRVLCSVLSTGFLCYFAWDLEKQLLWGMVRVSPEVFRDITVLLGLGVASVALGQFLSLRKRLTSKASARRMLPFLIVTAISFGAVVAPLRSLSGMSSRSADVLITLIIPSILMILTCARGGFDAQEPATEHW